jgi:hypothetical protein
LHNEYFTPFLELKIANVKFNYNMYYDHDVMEGDFDNAFIYDLTNYPKTIVPSKEEKASIYKRNELVR